LHSKGSALGIILDGSQHLFFPGDIREGKEPDTIFFVSKFPEDQSSTHTLKFDRTEKTKDALSFFEDGKLVGHYTTYDNWPDFSDEEAIEADTEWATHLSDPKNKSNWNRFVEGEFNQE
tara:strand:+ start:18275 stop:18631 length:357 start_codon:yes stop_codon:yes gene_type:complete